MRTDWLQLFVSNDSNIQFQAAATLSHSIMTSSNGNIFRVTGHLCGEFTGYRLSNQSWGWWFETLPCPLWRHCNAVINWCYGLQSKEPAQDCGERVIGYGCMVGSGTSVAQKGQYCNSNIDIMVIFHIYIYMMTSWTSVLSVVLLKVLLISYLWRT